MRKMLYVVVAALACSGCGTARQQQVAAEAARVYALRQQSYEAGEACQLKYPADDRKMAVAKAKCMNEAFNIKKSTYRYQDLFDLMNSTRIMLAEKYQNGLISLAERDHEWQVARTKLTTENDQWNATARNVSAAERAATAQEAAAEAAERSANRSYSCTQYSNGIRCD